MEQAFLAGPKELHKKMILLSHHFGVFKQRTLAFLVKVSLKLCLNYYFGIFAL